MSLIHDPQIKEALRTTGRRLSITTDPVFKFVFGSPQSGPVLASLLNALLGKDVDAPFEGLSIVSQEYPSPDPAMRSVRMDLVATDSQGRIINVEVQKYDDDRYAERLTVYVSRLVTYYTPQGAEMAIRRVVCLSLGDYPLPGLEGYPDAVVRLRCRPERPGYEVKGDLPLTVHVNLSQVRSQCKDKCVEDFDEWEKWCYYLAMEDGMATDEELEKIRRIVEADPAVREADRRFREALCSEDEALKMGLLQMWNSEMKYAGEMATAQVRAESKGMKVGLEKGMEKGMEKGFQKGMQENKLETAKAMKTRGLDISVISECTGLTAMQVEAL